MNNYEPLGSHIVVEMPDVAKETESGIIKSESMLKEERDKRDGHAKVVAVSQEVKNVKVGDTVLYGKYSGTELAHEGKDYLIMKESDIYAIV